MLTLESLILPRALQCMKQIWKAENELMSRLSIAEHKRLLEYLESNEYVKSVAKIPELK